MRRAIGLVTAMVLMLGGYSAGTGHAEGPEPIWADYYGRQIDLAKSLEGAQACLISSQLGNQCFDTEAELDQVLDAADGQRQSSLLATCSTALRLYAGTSFATPVMTYLDRGVTIGLGAFANTTSSYRVGACNSYLYNGGSTYPSGNTVANASASSMLGGWDNAIDSVYIS